MQQTGEVKCLLGSEIGKIWYIIDMFPFDFQKETYHHGEFLEEPNICITAIKQRRKERGQRPDSILKIPLSSVLKHLQHTMEVVKMEMKS